MGVMARFRPASAPPFRLMAWLAALGLLAAPTLAQDAPPPPPAQESPAETLTTFRPTVVEVENSQNLSAVPTSTAEMLDLENRIRRVVEKVLPATVGLVVGQGQGSGVIISPDGYVLTAAHVSGRPGQRVTVIMPDGTKFQGVSLGLNRELDDGLIKIEDPRAGNLPWAPLGRAKGMPLGSWTVALGHPGGYQQERPPVVRVGRILANNDEFLLTDNTLVGGDSGGPLFDLDGRVIGIHSRISSGIVNNVHVPADRFVDDWETLAGSRSIGGMEPRWLRGMQRATDGLETDPADVGDGGARVTRVVPEGPGDKAGIKVGDRIVGLGGAPIQNGQDLMLRRMGLRADEPVTYRIRRGEETLELELRPVRSRDLGRSGLQLDPGRGGDSPLAGGVMGIRLDTRYGQPGARFESVQDNGPAAAAGLGGGDVVVSFDGQFVRNAAELSNLLRLNQPGDTVVLGVQRDGRVFTARVTLGDPRELYPHLAR